MSIEMVEFFKKKSKSAAAAANYKKKWLKQWRAFWRVPDSGDSAPPFDLLALMKKYETRRNSLQGKSLKRKSKTLRKKDRFRRDTKKMA